MLCVFVSPRLRENEQRAAVLQQEREYYSSQARTLQQSLSQLTADKHQTEAELKVTRHYSAAPGLQLTHGDKTQSQFRGHVVNQPLSLCSQVQFQKIKEMKLVSLEASPSCNCTLNYP